MTTAELVTVTIDRADAKAAAHALEARAREFADHARDAALRMQGRPVDDPRRRFWHESATRWTKARYDVETSISALEAALWPGLPRTYLTRRWDA